MPNENELPNMKDLTGSLARFTNWLGNFNTVLQANSGSAIGLAAGAANLSMTSLMLESWTVSYGLITEPGTRTHPNIVFAQTLRFGNKTNEDFPVGFPGGIVYNLRAMIRKIQGAGTVTADMLANAGLTPRTKRRSTPLIPHSGPAVTLDRSAPHVMTVKYHQEGQNENSRKKPIGCKSVKLVWRCANGQSGASVASKNPAYIDVGAAQSGQRIQIQGFWVMGNSKESPGGNVIEGGVP
jgi:hypothetical protein